MHQPAIHDPHTGTEVCQLGDSAIPDFQAYDHVVVAFSGGKDSLACLLHLFELGCPSDKVELWHHEIDAKGSRLMDWACTPAYCKAVARAFGVPLYFSWREGGFEGEMLRENTPTGAVAFERPGPHGVELARIGGDSPKLGTRLQFPQISPNLAVRWCSAYLKIDVAARAITSQDRFNHSRTLFITGERAEESTGRAHYATHEPHRTDRRSGRLGRHVDQWRPVHQWSTAQVWSIIERWKVNPHPCYRLGYARCSCACCIFGNKDQWASTRVVVPEQFEDVATYESLFLKTIDRKLSLSAKADQGTPYSATKNAAVVAEARNADWNEPVILDEWVMPAGAFEALDGPC